MVVFDNSIFCLALHPKARAPSGVDRAKEQVEHLLDSLKDEKESIILPTPAFAEFLILAKEDAPEYIAKIRESSVFRVEAFDDRSAIELAQMEINARSKGDKRGSAVGEEWQKVKFDRQIIAIARVNGALRIYSDDPDIATHGKDCGIPVIPLRDLPPPAATQGAFPQFQASEGEHNGEANKTIPTEVRGSDRGRAESEARAETEAPTKGEREV